MKYILVTGGVISGVGKGIIASSFGTLLKAKGLQVTSIKIDPYINIDAGTFSPYEHGEVFVLDDGSEVDLDLGNYERFLDTTLRSNNNITTGKIYQHVIKKEREGKYLGKTVQVVPHVTDAIQEWVEKVAKTPIISEGKCEVPDVCIIELGGTIGDIEGMPFVEAFRQFQFRVKKENFCLAHVSLVPQPRSTGEQKTKPTQSSVRELRSLGLSPDIIICRSELPINQSVKEKISNFCHVAPNEVICIHDLSSIYKVPVLMETQGIVELFVSKLHLNIVDGFESEYFTKWKELTSKVEQLKEEVKISIVGKYTKLEDSYASVSRALQHAAMNAGYKVKIEYIEAENLEEDVQMKDPVAYLEAHMKLAKSDGVVVPGGFGKRGIEGKIVACKWCREKKIPFLGICLGLQVAVIEFARNVLKVEDATSKEFWDTVKENDGINSSSADDVGSVRSNNVKEVADGEQDEYVSKLESSSATNSFSDNFVIIDMPEHTNCEKGGTMRLGLHKTYFIPELKRVSKLFKLYGGTVNNQDLTIQERHRHRYEVNVVFAEAFAENGLHFVGVDEKNCRMEIMEMISHPYYVATQFHPEYLSRPLKPSPPFSGLILAACKKLDSHLKKLQSS